ncbi:autotransporter outer membrane beta-barrel domain-containing protein, partial [Campylobacter jejuni]
KLGGQNSNNATLTLINQGTIKGKIGIENGGSNFNGTITVKTFENKSGGTIDGHIEMQLNNNNNTGTISIENFSNEGTIKGKVGMQVNEDQNTGTIIVNTFHNKSGGTIDGRVYYGWSNKGTISVENFNNEGTINYNNTSNGGKAAVEFEKINATIKTFSNSGTITGESAQGVYFQGNVHIQTFHNTGTGFITGYGANSATNQGLRTGGGVVMTGGTIETFKNSGTITSNTEESQHYPAGVKLDYATVKTFENTGTISGPFGFITTQGTIDTFINKGIIESKGKSYDGKEAAIRIQTAMTSVSTITHLINEGTIKSDSHNGILIESGNKIGTIINKGTIETKLNGISFFDYGPGSSPEETQLGKIILEPGSSIKAEKNGIDIDVKTTKTIKADGIEVKAGASVSGGEAGIYLAKGDEIKAPITVSGTVSGGNAGIVNEGKMAKGITHNGEAELVISNQGLVGEGNDGNTVANNGSGSVRIKEWLVTTNEEGKLRTVHVGGSNTANVRVSHITVDQRGLDINELNDITNIISGVSTNNIANV